MLPPSCCHPRSRTRCPRCSSGTQAQWGQDLPARCRECLIIFTRATITSSFRGGCRGNFCLQSSLLPTLPWACPTSHICCESAMCASIFRRSRSRPLIPPGTSVCQPCRSLPSQNSSKCFPNWNVPIVCGPSHRLPTCSALFRHRRQVQLFFPLNSHYP